MNLLLLVHCDQCYQMPQEIKLLLQGLPGRPSGVQGLGHYLLHTVHHPPALASGHLWRNYRSQAKIKNVCTIFKYIYKVNHNVYCYYYSNTKTEP